MVSSGGGESGYTWYLDCVAANGEIRTASTGATVAVLFALNYAVVLTAAAPFAIALSIKRRGRSASMAKAVYIAADPPFWSWIADRVRTLGIKSVVVFNQRIDRELRLTVGQVLIAVAIGEDLQLPPELRARLSEFDPNVLRGLLTERAAGQIVARLDAGKVIVVCARDRLALAAQVALLKVEDV
jgi:hypothetical protein